MSELDSLTKSEMMRILEITATESARNHAMLLLGFRHGFRSSEIADLRFSDLDLEHKTIHIRRGKGCRENYQQLYENPNPLLCEMTVLRKALDVRPACPAGYVFVTSRGTRMSRSQVFRIFQAVATKAGLPKRKRHYHVARHTMAQTMLRGGATIAQVQQHGGWRDIQTVARYLAVTDETACAAAALAFA